MFLQQALVLVGFSFGVLGSLIFVIYFVILSFKSTSNLSKHSEGILKEFLHTSSSKQPSKRKISNT